MRVPSGMTEDEVLRTIDAVVEKIAPKFRFGYLQDEDLEQEGRLEALKALEKFRPERGTLYNFLCSHVHNRLFNFKRDNYKRPDKPCPTCPKYDPHLTQSRSECIDFDNKMDCGPYKKWAARDSRKQNIMRPIPLEVVTNHESEKNMTSSDTVVDNLSSKEALDLIDAKLPIALRADYLRMRGGISINKSRRDKIYATILEILHQNDSRFSD